MALLLVRYGVPAATVTFIAIYWYYGIVKYFETL
jgi:hypothetical protein